MDKKYAEYIAHANITAAHSYKILLILTTGAYMQSQLGKMLGIDNSHVRKALIPLKKMGLVEVVKTEGRNIFFRAVTDLRRLEAFIPGQTNMFDSK